MNRVIWFTGPSGAGKTTLANSLKGHRFRNSDHPEAVILDGDEMRASISLGAGFSKEDRTEHNLRVARLAAKLSQYQTVIVSVIAPIAKVREEISRICAPLWIYVKRTFPERKGHFYEEPKSYFTVDHDILDIMKSTRQVEDFIKHPKYSLFIGRYQPLHEGHIKLLRKILDEGKNIVVGLRDTPITESDPLTVEQRQELFREEFYREISCGRVVILPVPDIEDICHGRKVGWDVREIKLDKETEQISATKIREGNKK